MPLDSGLASVGFSLSKHHHKRWSIETKHFKIIRGDVIVLCFELEYLIGDAIANLLLPVLSIRSQNWLQKRHEELHREILDGFDLRRKIDILCSLLLSRFPHQKEKINELRSLLNQIKTLRNNMAHCPVIFKAVRKDSDLLQPYLETPKGYIHITEKRIKLNQANVVKAVEIINDLMRRILRRRRIKMESG